jgi:hypothetical protein
MHAEDKRLSKIRLITFTDFHDDSYSFYHFILFLYVLAVLLLYTTFGCIETFPYGHLFVLSSIFVTSLPVWLSFKKVFTARHDHVMKCWVACLFLLLATVGSYAIFLYSDRCDAQPIAFNVSVAELPSLTQFNLFTLCDGEVLTQYQFSGFITLRGTEVQCVVAPLVASAATFDPEQPVSVWVADFAPRVVLANWSAPLREIVRADKNLHRVAKAVIEEQAANHSLIASNKMQIFQWSPIDMTLVFDRRSFMIASSIIYGLLVINTLIPPIYFFFQHTRTATLEITEETYLLS